jgi:hypothetical protein
LPLLKHCIPSKVWSDLLWWHAQLSTDECVHILHLIPPPLPLKTFVDASTSFGIVF